MSRNSSHKRKTYATVTSEDECFNCHRMGHFGRDCKFPDYQSKKKNSGSSSTRQDRDNDPPRSRPRRANAATNIEEEDSDPEPFRPGKALMTAESSIMSKTRATWYLDSCASRHLTNDRSLFIEKIQPKTWDFTTAGGQVIRSEGVGTVRIALADGAAIELKGVALVPECESNLISLGQLRDSRITYHDENSFMMLMQDGVPIAQARRDRNLFVLDLATPGKVMQANVTTNNKHAMVITGRGRPAHLVSRNKKVRIWHRRFGHASC